MNKKINLKDVFITGFALFAMFFGAGNLIFPPYLGWSCASNWFLGFLSFILVDIGLSLLAIIVVAKSKNGPLGVTMPLGAKMSVILMCLNTICLGPIIAIPRTAATTFEFGIAPIFPSVNSWIFSIIFFAVVVALSIKQSKAVDIIGAILAPIMFISLFILIIKGYLSPLGAATERTVVSTVVRDGIKAGYQTMDMMGAVILSLALIVSIRQKGYNSDKSQFKMISLSGIISAAALFAVYGGLAYLGSSVSSVYKSTMSQAELLISITNGLMGKSGVILLGIIVSSACLTTAIGLLSSAATFFVNISNNKLKYEHLIILFACLSCAISNLGISAIINLASPILDLIYPILVILIFLGIFENQLHNYNIHKFACLAAFAVSVTVLINTNTGMFSFITKLPFASYGFPWICPAAAGGFIGFLIKPGIQSKTDTSYETA